MTSLAKKQETANKKKRLVQSIDDRLDTLAKAIDKVRASKIFTDYLNSQARFHKYSWNNSMLIAMQCPDATQVAGYQTWKKLNRQVRKGEHGIMIIAPCPFSKETDNKQGGTDTIEGIFFRAVHVFDIAQTDGPELPTVDLPTIEHCADDLLAQLVSVAHHRGIIVNFASLTGGVFGISKGGVVDVNNSHPTGQQAKTLAHELAHEALHKTNRGALTRSMAELEAESVAYVVCMHSGLDVEVRASHYIALWDGDSKALRASLDRISKTARGIIDDLDHKAIGKAVA